MAKISFKLDFSDFTFVYIGKSKEGPFSQIAVLNPQKCGLDQKNTGFFIAIDSPWQAENFEGSHEKIEVYSFEL